MRFLPPDGRDELVFYDRGEIVLKGGKVETVKLPSLVEKRIVIEPNHTTQIEIDMVGPNGATETRTIALKSHNAPLFKNDGTPVIDGRENPNAMLPSIVFR